MGLAILLHAVRMVRYNFIEALRVSALLYFVPILLTLILFVAISLGDPDRDNTVLVVLAVLVGVIGLPWAAVAWHRYILLDEQTEGVVPQFRGDRILAYIAGGLQLGLASLAAAVVVGVVVAIPMSATGDTELTAQVTAVISTFVVLVLNYRLAAILPGAALGRPMTLRAAWEATAGANAQLVILALVTSLASFLIDLPGQVFGYSYMGAILGLLWYVLTGWLKVMVGVSILTTLYGHFVEGRPLPQ